MAEFEQKLTALEAVVEKLERGDLSLDESVRLFEEGVAAGGLKLQKTSVTPSGVITATYSPAGAIPAGSHVEGPPSEAELKRRAEWAKEA